MVRKKSWNSGFDYGLGDRNRNVYWYCPRSIPKMNKKDYNYIASVEKAIAEKYGKDAVQDFRNTWEEGKEKEYLDQLKERNTKRKAPLGKMPAGRKQERTCPVCKTYSFSPKDDLYMNRFKCCFGCYVDFVEKREDRWDTGERPSEEHIKQALKRRK